MIAVADSPFVHAFAHNGRWYAYDVNTNDLLEVDAALGQTLAALTSEQPSGALERLTAEIGREAVGGALSEIEEAQREEGQFSCHRPRIVPRQLTEDDRAAYESKLSHLILSVTEDCNLACRYCPQTAQRPARPKHMSREVSLKALTYFAERCHDTESPAVSFYGGEPLLRFGLIREVIQHARAQADWPRLRFIIDTNGTLIDDEAADLVAREGLYLQVSLDGPQEVHDRWRVYRDGSGSHAAILAGLERVLRRDPSAADRMVLRATIAPPVDIGALATWSRKIAPYSECGLVQHPFVRAGFADMSWQDRGPTEADPLLAAGIAASRARWLDACACDKRAELDPMTRHMCDSDVIRFYHRSRQRLPEELAPGGCCKLGVRRLSVATTGLLGPCERSNVELQLGTIDRGVDVAQVEMLAAGFSRALGDRCRDCWAVRLCGLCYAALTRQDETGELVMREETCVEARHWAASMLRAYADLLDRGDAAAAFLQESVVS